MDWAQTEVDRLIAKGYVFGPTDFASSVGRGAEVTPMKEGSELARDIVGCAVRFPVRFLWYTKAFYVKYGQC